MSAEWAAHPPQPIQSTSTNQQTRFAKTLKLTVMWCHMVTMAVPYGDHGSERIKMQSSITHAWLRLQI
jgi:hypothetical protein